MKRRERQALLDAERDRAAQPPPESPDDGTRPSKSQRKRDMTALQALGEELLALQPSKLLALPLPPPLVEAIELARRISSHEGLRRQRQYIGRLMRDVDPAPIRAALDRDGAGHRAEVAAMHAAERWRERLLADPRTLSEFLERFPDPAPAEADARGAEAGADTADIEPGRAAPGARPAPDWTRLVDDARAEQARGEPGRRYRDLYRKLRDRIAEHTTAA